MNFFGPLYGPKMTSSFRLAPKMIKFQFKEELDIAGKNGPKSGDIKFQFKGELDIAGKSENLEVRPGDIK